MRWQYTDTLQGDGTRPSGQIATKQPAALLCIALLDALGDALREHRIRNGPLLTQQTTCIGAVLRGRTRNRILFGDEHEITRLCETPRLSIPRQSWMSDD
jgi:hypothetical protein